jgi:GT2 family glycosyltransferase
MGKPKVTVIVANYNSEAKWRIIEESLRSIFSLSYRPLEVIIIDNGSTDNSFELIKQFINKVKRNEDFNVKVIRLSKNYGFAVANIIGYRFRDPSSKYVALINNDFAPEPDSLDRLVRILEISEKIAGVQGIILTWDGSHILTYGGFITDSGELGGIGAFTRFTSDMLASLKPIMVTYLDGAYSIYRVSAIEKAGGLFMPYFFMWGDDYELGIRLWRTGFILLAVPIVAGRHYAGAVTQLNKSGSIYEPSRTSYIYEYWSWVSNVAVTTVLYGYPYMLQLLRRLPITFAPAILRNSKAIIGGFFDGIKLGITLRARVLKEKPWLKVPKEPRFKTHLLFELIFLAYLFLKYKTRASRIYYILIARALLKHLIKNARIITRIMYR